MGELRGLHRVITLLEPPRPAGLTSGGFRYQERVVTALGSAAQRLQVSPENLYERARQLRREQPQAAVLVDGWFAELTQRPLPPGVIALLHAPPSLEPWGSNVRRAIATGTPTADAVRDDVDQLTIVRPGIDDCFKPAPRGGDQAIALICAGTVCAAKGQRRLVGALRGATAPWRLTIVGSTSYDPAEVERLRRDADGLPVTIRDAVRAEQLADMYVEHDLFVTLSCNESFGMAAAEAAASGLPLLGLATGELDTFGHERARWILPTSADDCDIQDTLHRLLEEPGALRDLRAQRAPPPRKWQDAANELSAACS